MNVEERITCLRKTDLFEPFTNEELHDFATSVREVRLSPGQVLFYEGAEANDMYVIIEGALKIFKESRSITTIKAVDYIGEMAIIEAQPRSATVEAVEDCLLLQITLEQFQSYFARQPVALVSMMRTLSRRIRKDTKMIAEEFEKANIMIHDMKNMMTIFLFLDALKEMVPQSRALNYIKFMEDGREDLMAMMREALANAKNLYRPMPLVQDSLNDLLTEMIKSEFSAHPELSQRVIKVTVDDQMPEFAFCRLEIRRVITNLVLNGVQASRGDSPVEIRAGRDENNAVIQVVDQGSGIREEYCDKIFTPHFTTKENGNGLGLPSCQRIIDRHCGTLNFTTKPDKGTTFTFTLPLTAG